MKKMLIAVGCIAFLAAVQTSEAQFKAQIDQEPRVSDGMINAPGNSFLFGWFNPANFQMRQSLEMSYQTFGGQGMSLGTYTNSMMYSFTNNLHARADVSLSYSPFNSFSSFKGTNNNLSSLYLSRLQMDYKPWDNVLVQFQYRKSPYAGSMYSPLYNPWGWENGY